MSLAISLIDSRILPGVGRSTGPFSVTCMQAVLLSSSLAAIRTDSCAPHVPAVVVGQGLSRSLEDNAAGIATWLDAREPCWGGDLTQKRSVVRAHQVLPGVRGGARQK
jgi:hypothetical protein